jgi:hypothetical protein
MNAHQPINTSVIIQESGILDDAHSSKQADPDQILPDSLQPSPLISPGLAEANALCSLRMLSLSSEQSLSSCAPMTILLRKALEITARMGSLITWIPAFSLNTVAVHDTLLTALDDNGQRRSLELCKTTAMESFVRNLYLHGFRKLTEITFPEESKFHNKLWSFYQCPLFLQFDDGFASQMKMRAGKLNRARKDQHSSRDNNDESEATSTPVSHTDSDVTTQVITNII